MSLISTKCDFPDFDSSPGDSLEHFLFTSQHAIDLGPTERIQNRLLEDPRFPDTVVPLFHPRYSITSCYLRRSGPVFGYSGGVFRASLTGKYMHCSRTVPHSDDLPVFSHRSGNVVELEEQTIDVVSTEAVGPGCMYQGNEEVPRYPDTVAKSSLSKLLICSRLQRHPGPVFGHGSGAF